MTVLEQILAHKHGNSPFSVYLNDGRRFRIPVGDFVSTHPSGKGTNLIVYGAGEGEEHFIPVFAVSSVSLEA
jgi:hypothetical protein